VTLQPRVLHFISKVTAAGRMLYAYRYGAIPVDPAEGGTRGKVS
jgi:hypothetical protein